MKKLILSAGVYKWVKITSALFFITLAFTGIILQGTYHLEKHPDSYTVWGADREIWLMIHKIFCVLVLITSCYHIYMNRKWIINTFSFGSKKKIANRKRNSIWLFILFCLAIVTSLIPWFFISDLNMKKHYIEIHDKLALALVIVTVIHLIQHRDWVAGLVRGKRN